MGTCEHGFTVPELADDYEALWKIYSEDSAAWDRLCRCLSEYEAQQKPLAKLSAGSKGMTANANDAFLKEAFSKDVYFLPEFTYTTISELLQKLKA